MRILVVEDDASIAEFVAAGLRQAGYAVDAGHVLDGHHSELGYMDPAHLEG